MNRQSIDLKYISGRGIGSLVPFRRPCLYTTIYISSPSTGPRPHRQKTPLDQHGAGNPEWNHPIRLYLDSDYETTSPDLTLNFDIRTQVPVVGDKVVGHVKVPLADLASEGPAGTLHHVSYQVTNPDGKANGVLTFSYILNKLPVGVSDPAPVQDTVTLYQGTSNSNSSNNVEHQELYSPVKKAEPKLHLYPTLDFLDHLKVKPFISRSLFPTPNPQVYPPPPPPVPDSKPSLYPVVSTEPVITYPVPDSRVNGHSPLPPSFASYPQVEPVSAIPGYYPPPQASQYSYQTHGWDGRYY